MEKTLATFLLSVMILGLLDVPSNASQINDITCGEAGPLILPCVQFLQGSGPGQPSAFCCSGAKSIFVAATSTQNRRALCECFKQAAPLIGLNPNRSKQLPKLCNINLPFDLDSKIDCNS
ncbi:PREDICTED: non-specific lipid-transfer protein 1-like [Lupinus angustifolius]|uniref:non-specific lipid-transfer protein 1-like n=1 Tax=Lupinus angustifolius TaxID=3871 RepID=UPI00092F1F7C|nr:PREDICTED: non-specific lipid-transfer protein 1-like [Lupinus angustifolius]